MLALLSMSLCEVSFNMFFKVTGTDRRVCANRPADPIQLYIKCIIWSVFLPKIKNSHLVLFQLRNECKMLVEKNGLRLLTHVS